MISTLTTLGSAGDAAGGEGIASAVLSWFEMDATWKIWLVVFGLVGQGVFFARWIIQWIASEVRGESHIPVLFWWASLLGATMLFLYFLLDRDPVGLLGQSVGWSVYCRNLYLIRRKRRRRAASAHASSPTEER